jgi:hypothetical protein
LQRTLDQPLAAKKAGKATKAGAKDVGRGAEVMARDAGKGIKTEKTGDGVNDAVIE